MLDRAKRLSSTQDVLSQECKNLKEIFLELKYPEKFINSAINRLQHPKDPVQTPSDSPVRITLPFKDQKSADVVRRQLGDLGTKINHQLQPVFTSKNIADHLRVTEEKPPLINQQSVVYELICDLCDTNYIGYTCRHLHQRVSILYSDLPFPHPKAMLESHVYNGWTNISIILSEKTGGEDNDHLLVKR